MKSILLSMTALVCVATAPAAIAKDANTLLIPVMNATDVGGSERVEAAALLRVLSQEAASAACHMSYDVNPREARRLMTEAKEKFSVILAALEHGDPQMNIIGAEERQKTLLKIKAVGDLWDPMYSAAVTLLDDPKNKEALAVVKADNEAVLKAASILTSELAGQYSNPAELLQTDVMMIDFAGRQAMLTQKMGKIACEIWAGNDADDRRDLLVKTMQTYDMTLSALLNGMPAVGLLPAPTDEIEAVLTHATTAWRKTKSELDVVLAGGPVPEALKGELFHDLNLAMYEMEELEHLYVVYSKHDYSNDDPAAKLID